MVGILVTLVKAGIVFGLLALTVKMLRRYDRRVGTTRRGPGRGGRGGRRTGGGGRRTGQRQSERVLDVVERAALGRTASAVLVRVHDQHFLLGVTDSEVSMLLEVDLPAEEDAIDLRTGNMPGDLVDRATSFGAELLRQTRLRLPHATKVETLDPATIGEEGGR